MAQKPTHEHVRQIKEEAAKRLAAKVADQQAQGKTFHVDAAGHGPGVIPEEIWTTLPGKVQK